jgi:hypothetical protein
MAFSEVGIGIANLAGFLALFFIIATAVMMFIETHLFNRFHSHKALIRNIHIVIAVLGGAFLLLHVNYFLNAPILNTGSFSVRLHSRRRRRLVHRIFFSRKAEVLVAIPRVALPFRNMLDGDPLP